MDIWERVAPLRRPCWLPETEEGGGPLDGSKFSGIPWLGEGEAWPACANCGEPMQLFVQLNAGSLPPGAGQPFGTGLLQMFYCTNKEAQCEVECEAWAPFGSTVLLRVVEPAGAPRRFARSPVPEPIAPRQIVRWTADYDYPAGEERRQLGIDVGDAGEMDGFPREGEKLLGWPLWVQGVEYPNCPDCGARMQHLFQLDSEKNLDYMFGDMGCGHITQCRNHPRRLAFGWSCC
ncbi:MAG: DUF1963 domain-containing protein [Planctomycetota bacterium]|nr:DUF1963 domain-containing protein [Planctomycetota bacterium]